MYKILLQDDEAGQELELNVDNFKKLKDLFVDLVMNIPTGLEDEFNYKLSVVDATIGEEIITIYSLSGLAESYNQILVLASEWY